MTITTNREFTDTSHPPYSTKAELIKAIISARNGQQDITEVADRVARTDLTGITGASTTTRPALDYIS